MAVAWCHPFVSLADSTGTITVESAKIREKADITSNVIGSAPQGKTVTITDQVTDDSGTVWYQVYVDADTLGYIRSDLLSKEGGDSDNDTSSQNDTAAANESTTDNASSDNSNAAGGAEVQAETVMDAQYATVSVKAAKIRTAPSTNDGVVETLAEGKQIVVSGKSNGSDGKEWYYVTFIGADGAEKTGFVRYDLVSLGDMVPVEEEIQEEPVEEPVQTENINNDYELKYEQDGSEYVWYLYNNLAGNKQKLEPLMEAAEQAMAGTSSADTDMVVRQRIIIVVLGVLAVALVIAVTIMAFKLRDAYYEDYEDEDDEEEEEEEPEEEIRPAKRKVRSETVAEDQPEEPRKALRRKAAREETPVKQRAEKRPVMQEVTYQEEPDVKVPVKTPPKRKAKNFLLDDDDFEFEFLNMDDKDLQ